MLLNIFNIYDCLNLRWVAELNMFVGLLQAGRQQGVIMSFVSQVLVRLATAHHK
jgi:hypothetical protein